MSPIIALYAAILLAVLAVFGWSCYRRFRFVSPYRPDNRFNNIGRHIRNMLLYALIPRRVGNQPFGTKHFVLFWSFMILLLANTVFLLNGLFSDYIIMSRLPVMVNYALSFTIDIASLLALLAVCIAILHRLAFPMSYVATSSRDAFTILSLVGILMIAFLGRHASEIRLGQEEAAAYMPVSSFVANVFMSRTLPVALSWRREIFLWINLFALLAFVNYLPYGKRWS